MANWPFRGRTNASVAVESMASPSADHDNMPDTIGPAVRNQLQAIRSRRAGRVPRPSSLDAAAEEASRDEARWTTFAIRHGRAGYSGRTNKQTNCNAVSESKDAHFEFTRHKGLIGTADTSAKFVYRMGAKGDGISDRDKRRRAKAVDLSMYRTGYRKTDKHEEQ